MFRMHAMMVMTTIALLAASLPPVVGEMQARAAAPSIPPSGVVLADAARANLFMLTAPVDAVYHGGSG